MNLTANILSMYVSTGEAEPKSSKEIGEMPAKKKAKKRKK
jgi:hypothetical protein